MELLLPRDPIISKYVSSIYIFEKGGEPVKYTSYPSPNVATALMRNAEITDTKYGSSIKASTEQNYIVIACPRLYYPITMEYTEMVDEIAINFTPVGFLTYTQCPHQERMKHMKFQTWDGDMKELFDNVFSTKEKATRLNMIETFLQKHYVQLEDEPAIDKVVEMLSDMHNNDNVERIAEKASLHYKDMYRKFKKLVGCTPAHYRKIVRFRQSVYAKLNSTDLVRLTDLCYAYDYTDQSYFIKQFHELTGENPKAFFKGISPIVKNQIFWKYT